MEPALKNHSKDSEAPKGVRGDYDFPPRAFRNRGKYCNQKHSFITVQKKSVQSEHKEQDRTEKKRKKSLGQSEISQSHICLLFRSRSLGMSSRDILHLLTARHIMFIVRTPKIK